MGQGEDRLTKIFFQYIPWFPCFPPLISPSQRRIREHMIGLFRSGDWLKELVTEQDLANWRPEIEECCTAGQYQFKLHFKGTPCDPWNSSATRVFTDDFLHTHTETYPDVWAVRRMVLRKTKAYIKSLIKTFRQKNLSDTLRQAAKLAKNRQERKASVSPLPHSDIRSCDVKSHFSSFSAVVWISRLNSARWSLRGRCSTTLASMACLAMRKRGFWVLYSIGSSHPGGDRWI